MGFTLTFFFSTIFGLVSSDATLFDCTLLVKDDKLVAGVLEVMFDEWVAISLETVQGVVDTSFSAATASVGDEIEVVLVKTLFLSYDDMTEVIMTGHRIHRYAQKVINHAVF